MRRLTVALRPVEITEFLEEVERVLIQPLDHRQRVDKLTAVVIDFYHLFHVFQFQHIIIRQPFCIKHLIRLPFLIMAVIFFRMLIHKGASKHF